MRELAITFALRGLLCGALSWFAWRVGGVSTFVVTIAVWGLVFARPLMDLAIELHRQARTLTWQPLEGRHAVFRGTPVQVLEDADRRRWIRAADVRRIVGYTASEAALALTYPDGWRRVGKPAEPHFSDDALLAHLATERSPVALKFRHWVEREIAFPARRQRERFGIRDAPADLNPGD
jgi:hypothetical protein